MTKVQKHRIRLASAAIMAVVFGMIPVLVDEAINRFAPISWWVDVQEIRVSDLEMGTMHQEIEIHRKVRRELNGWPRQELYLVTSQGEVEIISTGEPTFLADYEKRDGDVEYLPLDFWERKGIKDDLLKQTSEGEVYRWVWVIEFIKPNGTTEIERHGSNWFKLTERLDAE